MNYGIAGNISPHFDTAITHGSQYSNNEDNTNDIYINRETSEVLENQGGERLTTIMIYLSNVVAGGHTIFPQLGNLIS